MWKSLFQVENILDKDESERDEERKDEEIPARESELFSCESDTGEMLERFLNRCYKEKSNNRA